MSKGSRSVFGWWRRWANIQSSPDTVVRWGGDTSPLISPHNVSLNLSKNPSKVDMSRMNTDKAPSSERDQINKRLTQLSRRHPRDALCQLKCCPTVVRITQTDRVSASDACSISNYHFLFGYLQFYTRSVEQARMRFSVCHTRVTLKCAVRVVNRLPRQPTLLMAPHSPQPTRRMDTNSRL